MSFSGMTASFRIDFPDACFSSTESLLDLPDDPSQLFFIPEDRLKTAEQMQKMLNFKAL